MNYSKTSVDEEAEMGFATAFRLLPDEASDYLFRGPNNPGAGKPSFRMV
jgi:hypothetical protein